MGLAITIASKGTTTEPIMVALCKKPILGFQHEHAAFGEGSRVEEHKAMETPPRERTVCKKSPRNDLVNNIGVAW